MREKQWLSLILLAALAVAGSPAVSADSATDSVKKPLPLPPAWSTVAELLEESPLERGETLKAVTLGSGHFSTAVVIQLAGGASVPGHIHRDHDEFVQVVRGGCVMVVGRERLELAAGSLIMVPAGVPHGALAHATGCAVVSTYSPVWDPADRHRDPRGDVLVGSEGGSEG